MTGGVIRRLKDFNYAAERTYFVTLCVAGRRKAFSDVSVCESARHVILSYREQGWYWLNCYCLMPDHLHLLIRLRGTKHKLSSIIAKLKRRIREQSWEISQLRWQWQPGFHDHIVREYEKVEDFVKYILANPVRAKLSDGVTQYPYCGVVDPSF